MSSAALEPAQAALVIVNPSGQKKRIPLGKQHFTIGRQADNDVVIRDNRASRHHARIVLEEGSYVVEDLRSTHGVWVNGKRVEKQRLRNGDVITFGVQDSYELTLALEDGELHRLLDRVPGPEPGSASSAGPLAKLRSVIEVARALQTSLTIDEVLETVVDAALTVTGSERGFLLLRTGDDLEIRVARDHNGARVAAEDLRVPTTLIHRALRERRDLLSMNFDPNSEQGLRPEGTVASLELRSVVCVPLVHVRTGGGEETVHTSFNDTVGLIYLDSRAGAADLSSGNRELLQSLAIEASMVLENARLLEEERIKHKLQEEMNIARTIQESLFPKELPTTGWYRAAGSSIASFSVGGDYYDVIQVTPALWSTVVADVSGKGVSSALLASLLQGAFLRAASGAEGVMEMLDRLNRFLVARTGGEKYATLFYSLLSADGTMLWANAAHVAPVVVRSGGKTEMLEPTGMPVGMLDIATYEVRTTRLEPGDKLVLYTDGLTDARDEQGRFYDTNRLLEAVSAHCQASCVEMHDMIINELEAFTGNEPQGDDITLVVVEYRPESHAG